jgi:hypothetical protein
MPYLICHAASHHVVDETVTMCRHRDQITAIAISGSADFVRRVAARQHRLDIDRCGSQLTGAT